MSKDGTGNVPDALKHIGIALAGALVIYLCHFVPVLLFIVPPIVCGAGGWLADAGDTIKQRKVVAFVWAGIGLAAGIGFFLSL